MNAIDPVYLTRAQRGARGANKRWAKQEPWSAYALPAKKSSRWIILWQRRGGKRHQGSVDTQQEAEAIVAVIAAALRAGIEPPKLPRGRASSVGAQTSVRSSDEIAVRRAHIAKILAGQERCGSCGLLRPCAPCIGEQRTELLSARRGE